MKPRARCSTALRAAAATAVRASARTAHAAVRAAASAALWTWAQTCEVFAATLKDLRAFTRLQAAAVLVFGAWCIICSFIEFNAINADDGRSIYKPTNDEQRGIAPWRRQLMATSGAASFTGALSVVLTTMGRRSSFVWGAINSALYGAAALSYDYVGDFQVNLLFFLPAQFVGLAMWRTETPGEAVAPRSLSHGARLSVAAALAFISMVFYYEVPAFSVALSGGYFYDGLPTPRLLDSLSTAFNIVAQLLCLGRFWEQWLLWLAVDAMQIAMYCGVAGFIDVNLVTMWILFTVNALFGLWLWVDASSTLGTGPRWLWAQLRKLLLSRVLRLARWTVRRATVRCACERAPRCARVRSRLLARFDSSVEAALAAPAAHRALMAARAKARTSASAANTTASSITPAALEAATASAWVASLAAASGLRARYYRGECEAKPVVKILQGDGDGALPVAKEASPVSAAGSLSVSSAEASAACSADAVTVDVAGADAASRGVSGSAAASPTPAAVSTPAKPSPSAAPAPSLPAPAFPLSLTAGGLIPLPHTSPLPGCTAPPPAPARVGLCVGKFYPYHAGHRHLLTTAAAAVDALYVLVCERPGEAPCGELRAGWIREDAAATWGLLPGKSLTVGVLRDVYDSSSSPVWAVLARRWLGGRAPDLVATSEAYGPAWAAALGPAVTHLAVDAPRMTFPISGTAARACPWGPAVWPHLGAAARRYYGLRVVLIGPESCGKTTLAARLASAFDTAWVREVGRDVTEEKQAAGASTDGVSVPWATQDFSDIALAQGALEDATMATAKHGMLVADTDPLATCVWHWRYMGAYAPELEVLACERDSPAVRHPGSTLYLLADPSTPFVQDGTRDGEHVRTEMFGQFEALLKRLGKRYVTLSGADWGAREAAAMAAVAAFRQEVGAGDVPVSPEAAAVSPPDAPAVPAAAPAQ